MNPPFAYYTKAIEIACKNEIERENAPQLALYYVNLDFAFRALQKEEEAEEVYREAINIKSDDAEYQNTLGNMYFQRNNYEKAN